MTRRKYSENAEHNEVINKLYSDIRKLEEHNRQLQLALGNQDINCTWEQLCNDIGRKNKNISSLLRQAFVRRFQRGRITLNYRDLSASDKWIATCELKRFLRLYTAQRWQQPFIINIKIIP